MRDTAADIADTLRGVTQPIVADAVSRLSLIVLAVVLVPVGIVIVVVGFVAMTVAHRALGSPTGILASVITVAGLLGMLAALFFTFRALYRRMPRRLRAVYAAPMEGAGRDGGKHAIEPGPGPGRFAEVPAVRDTPAPTLAELDARLGLEQPPAERN